MGNCRDCGNVEHVKPRVAHGFAKKEFGVGPHRSAPAVDVAGLDEGGVDAKAAQRVVQQVLAAAIERGAGHDVAAGAHQRGNAQVQRGLAAGHGNGANTAFERADALLQHRVGRVADAAVDMAGALQVEQRLGVVAGLKHK